VERVDEDVACAPERREDAAVEARDVGDAEDVGRGLRREVARAFALEERRQVEVAPAFGALARLERAAARVEREPDGALPALRVALLVVGRARGVLEGLAAAPGAQQ